MPEKLLTIITAFTFLLFSYSSTTQQRVTGGLKALSNSIVGSHLITLKGEGHTGYGRGSACTDAIIDAFLIYSKTPLKTSSARSNHA